MHYCALKKKLKLNLLPYFIISTDYIQYSCNEPLNLNKKFWKKKFIKFDEIPTFDFIDSREQRSSTHPGLDQMWIELEKSWLVSKTDFGEWVRDEECEWIGRLRGRAVQLIHEKGGQAFSHTEAQQ